MKRFFILFLVFLLILPNIVKAQTPYEWFRYVLTSIFGLPENWTYRDYLWMGLIPFLGIWLIIFGFLNTIRIFGREKTKLYLLLSFFIAFSTLPLGWFAVFVSYMFSVIGVWTTVLFLILFIIGTVFMARGLWRGWKAGTIEQALGVYDAALHKAYESEKKAKEEANMLRKQAEDLQRKVRSGEIAAERAAIDIEKLNEQLKAAQQKIEAEETKRKQLEEQVKKLKERMKKK